MKWASGFIEWLRRDQARRNEMAFIKLTNVDKGVDPETAPASEEQTQAGRPTPEEKA